MAVEGPIVQDLAVVEVRLFNFLPSLSQIGLNVIHYRATGQVGVGVGLINIADHMSQTFSAEYINLQGPDSEFSGATAKTLMPTVSGSFGSNDNAGAGTQVGSIAPSQVAGIITKRTAVSGAKGRGRVYVPFPLEEDNDGGRPNQNYIDRMQLLADAMALTQTIVADPGVDELDLVPVLWQRTTSLHVDIFQWRVSNRWGTQRRRGNYGALNQLPLL